jgi:sulfane dehydrogenase subunit SoxC
MDVKSVITSPSPQAPITHGKGPLVITGLAWSGNGTIKRVDVTLDGGRNWQRHGLTARACPRRCTASISTSTGTARSCLLQSRAIDDQGLVQPTKNELREARGENSIYHNNGIQTWHVNNDGVVENVEVS